MGSVMKKKLLNLQTAVNNFKEKKILILKNIIINIIQYENKCLFT